MVEALGRTPEEIRQTLRKQMAEAEKRASDARELVNLIKNAKASGFDSRREVEVEVDPDGRLVKLSIDDEALEDADARDVEDAIMEAYADAGRNMRDYIHRQTTERFGDDGGTLKDYLTNLDANLGSLGR
ncbi:MULTISPECIES: YbaB/EbfC family nucleoid-associated protein [Actinomycetes]|uniref:YbaB/EbfC family nucleoid-associated protein n=1 Tax=Actinomycetes TaxID=1760 RepID=UPI000660C4A5|nr:MULTISPECIES: YbaB/EbfC family nucleoid-associated protein [Actinomycetes]MCM3898665.1 YbaB/EbfC family nucleoid-associated protein [Schaalia meyeri]